MTNWGLTLITLTTLLTILSAVFWRFSVFIKLAIDKYKDDGKIDHDEFVELFQEALSIFKWIFSLFGVDLSPIVPVEVIE